MIVDDEIFYFAVGCTAMFIHLITKKKKEKKILANVHSTSFSGTCYAIKATF